MTAPAKPVRGDLARRMLAEGVPLRDVLKACGVRQVRIARTTRRTSASVSRILGSDAWARKEGRKNAEAVYRAAAAALGLTLEAVPEWARLFPAEAVTT